MAPTLEQIKHLTRRPMDSKSLTATCLTQHHGIHRVPVESDSNGILPTYVSVKVTDAADNNKFDPRKDWNEWINSDIDPRAVYIKAKHLIGTVYIQEDLPFIKKLQKREAALQQKAVTNLMTSPLRFDSESLRNILIGPPIMSKASRHDIPWCTVKVTSP